MKCGVDMSNMKTTTKTIGVGKQKDGGPQELFRIIGKKSDNT